MLIINQVKGDYTAHHPTIGLYLNKVKLLLKTFEKYEILQISRGENGHADAVENIASTINYSIQRTIPFKYLTVLSIHELKPEVIATINA